MKLQHHLINKVAELLKFTLTLGFMAVLVFKAPNEISQIVSLSAAFILGSSAKLKNIIGSN